MGRDRAGSLRITTECYTCYHWLPPLLLRFRRTFPRVEVRIDVEATHHPVEMLLAGKIDLGLMSTPVRDRRLVSRRVFDDELVLIASKHHRFARQTRVRLAQMRDETLFVYPPKEESGPLQNVLLPAGAAPARVEEVQLTEAITELVKAGLGVAILARWAVQPLIDAGTIVGRALPARGMHRVWSAVMRKDLARADYVERVHRPAREARADARGARQRRAQRIASPVQRGSETRRSRSARVANR